MHYCIISYQIFSNRKIMRKFRTTSFRIPLKQTDLNGTEFNIETNSEDNCDKKQWKYSSPGSTNDESYNSMDWTSDLWELSGTKYCLDNIENKDKLKTRVYVGDIQKNKDQIMQMFKDKPIDITKIIESIKWSICHDFLDEECNQWSEWKSIFWSMCQAKFEIKNSQSWPSFWESSEIIEVDKDTKFLISCIKIKWENYINGCEFSNKSLRMIHNHEKECQYIFKSCTYCKQSKILEKDWGYHIFNKWKAINKCSHWPDWNFIGLKQQVEQHEEFDCDYLHIIWDTIFFLIFCFN